MAAELIERMEFFSSLCRRGDLSAAELRVSFALLFRFYNRDTGRCDPGRAALVKETGLHAKTIQKAIGDLEQGGAFRVVRGGGTTSRYGATTRYEPLFQGGARRLPVSQTAPCEPNGSGGAKRLPKGEPTDSPEPVIEPVNISTATFDLELTPSNTITTAEKSRRKTKDPRFLEFWNAYPQRGRLAGPKCEPKYLRIIGAGELTHEQMMAAVRSYAKSQKVRDGYVCHMATWLNEQRWTAELEADGSTSEPIYQKSRAVI